MYEIRKKACKGKEIRIKFEWQSTDNFRYGILIFNKPSNAHALPQQSFHSFFCASYDHLYGNDGGFCG